MKLETILDPLQSLREDAESQPFSLKTLSSINSFSQRVQYAYSKLQGSIMGRGSSRVTFKYKGMALKIALYNTGIAQNSVEFKIGQELLDVVIHSYEKGPGYIYILSELANPHLNEWNFEKLTGIDFFELRSISSDFYRSHVLDTSDPKRGNVSKSNFRRAHAWKKEMQGNLWLKEILNMVKKYKIIDFRIDNFGTVIRDGEKKVVLIDPGFNTQVNTEFYGHSGPLNIPDLDFRS